MCDRWPWRAMIPFYSIREFDNARVKCDIWHVVPLILTWYKRHTTFFSIKLVYHAEQSISTLDFCKNWPKVHEKMKKISRPADLKKSSQPASKESRPVAGTGYISAMNQTQFYVCVVNGDYSLMLYVLNVIQFLHIVCRSLMSCLCAHLWYILWNS